MRLGFRKPYYPFVLSRNRFSHLYSFHRPSGPSLRRLPAFSPYPSEDVSYSRLLGGHQDASNLLYASDEGANCIAAPGTHYQISR